MSCSALIVRKSLRKFLDFSVKFIEITLLDVAKGVKDKVK